MANNCRFYVYIMYNATLNSVYYIYNCANYSYQYHNYFVINVMYYLSLGSYRCSVFTTLMISSILVKMPVSS